ncbi:MAG: excisionase, partial [Oscillospiraceae bacterium]|nr:excisionase [Oscillospiraceae bacterium]
MENCIGINKIGSMLRAPSCPFVLSVGTKSRTSAGSLKSTSAAQWQFEGKFT